MRRPRNASTVCLNPPSSLFAACVALSVITALSSRHCKLPIGWWPIRYVSNTDLVTSFAISAAPARCSGVGDGGAFHFGFGLEEVAPPAWPPWVSDAVWPEAPASARTSWVSWNEWPTLLDLSATVCARKRAAACRRCVLDLFVRSR